MEKIIEMALSLGYRQITKTFLIKDNMHLNLYDCKDRIKATVSDGKILCIKYFPK